MATKVFLFEVFLDDREFCLLEKGLEAQLWLQHVKFVAPRPLLAYRLLRMTHIS